MGDLKDALLRRIAEPGTRDKEQPMPPTISFFVEDVPRPGGSKRAFLNKKSGRAMIVDASGKVKTWRNTVKFTARSEYDGPPLQGPIYMGVTFYMRRPKAHYRTGRNASLLKASAPERHIQKPDLTKLIRSTEDALTGICWHDDCQVVCRFAQKRWSGRSEREGAEITIMPMGGDLFTETLESPSPRPPGAAPTA